MSGERIEVIQIYGWGPQEILKVQRWLMCQNATLKDLDCSSLQRHHWCKQKLFDAMERFK